ncbi:MAG: class II aldolase/adducin family protein [Thermodesulfobacteriota bacterium]|nr:class II aldolase/adducin family protein [Thermodesulfobacteriota bacterium]
MDRYKRELAQFSRLSYDRGLVAARGGNLSIRIPGTDEILITIGKDLASAYYI